MIEALVQRLGYNQRKKVVESLLEREPDAGFEAAGMKAQVVRVVPEIRLDSGGEQEEMWGWEEGEDLEYEFLEQEEGAVSN